MTCWYCGRPLCENHITGLLLTGDSNPNCSGHSPDGLHHLERQGIR